ncbi:hypothetical protein Tco_0998616 [Tanacetum coccineum]
MDSGNIHESPLRSHEAPLSDGNRSGSAEDNLKLKELMAIVPKMVTKIDSLEKELKKTKQTLGHAVLTLVKKVKSLEVALKRMSKRVILSDSEDEETKNQGRKIQDIDDDPLVSLVRESMKEKEANFTSHTKASASSEAQDEDISPTILEAAQILSQVVEVALEQALCLFEFWGFSSFNGWKLVHVDNRIRECSYPQDHFPFLDSFVGERDHDMVQKLKVIGQRVWLFGPDILKKPSEKHGIRESHFATLSHTYHSMSDIVSKIEMFANGETIEHVTQGCIGVIFVTGETYGIFTNDDVPLLEFIS